MKIQLSTQEKKALSDELKKKLNSIEYVESINDVLKVENFISLHAKFHTSIYKEKKINLTTFEAMALIILAEELREKSGYMSTIATSLVLQLEIKMDEKISICNKAISELKN